MVARAARAKLRTGRPYRRKLRLRLRLPLEFQRNDRYNPPTGDGKTVTTSRGKTAAPVGRPMPNPKGAGRFPSYRPGENRAPFRLVAGPWACSSLALLRGRYGLNAIHRSRGPGILHIRLWCCGTSPRRQRGRELPGTEDASANRTL